MPETKEQTEEHSIIFNGWSIRRLLAGGKTQTRRVVKPQPPDHVVEVMGPQMHSPTTTNSEGVLVPGDPVFGAFDKMGDWGAKCPYGKPGDRLWVREAFRLPGYTDELSPREFLDIKPEAAWAFKYVTDGDSHGDEGPTGYPKGGWGCKRPPIFMPRELSRLRLRVEDVQVEQLQEITLEDAIAEGIDLTIGDPPPQWDFKDIWNDIYGHGEGAWEENPWVWVVSFSKLNE